MAKKRYRVIGESVVVGHAPGEEFEFDFSEGYNEQAILDSGAVEVLGDAVPESQSKAELLAQAQELGLDVRANMSKAEIAAAVDAYEKEV